MKNIQSNLLLIFLVYFKIKKLYKLEKLLKITILAKKILYLLLLG